MKTFVLPDLGEGLHDATIIEWYAQEQQTLKLGERLLAVETAKAVVEIPASEDLTLVHILAPAGTVLKVGMPLLDYEPAGIARANPVASPSMVEHGASVSVVGTLAEAGGQQAERPFIPGAERFSAAEKAEAATRLAKPSAARIPASAGQLQPLSGSRLSMSQQLALAHQQVALVTLFDEVAVNWPKTVRPLPRLIKALCAACRAEPKVNAWFHEGGLEIHKQVNLGLAVNTTHGLYVPVLTGADSLSGKALASELAVLQTAAHEHRLSAGQLQGATISLSNFGMLAGRFATPMVMPPQVAIVGVGHIEPKTLLNSKGKVKIRTVIPLSLSFDHRALTGAEAAAFMAALMQALQKK